MTTTVQSICRYPVKGLTAEKLDKVEVTAGEGLPGDRHFAMAHANSHVDLDRPHWVSRNSFLVLANDEKLAQLESVYDPDTGVLVLKRNGRQVCRGDLSSPTGRMLIEQFLDAFLPPGPRGTAHIVEAISGESFTDRQENHLSIINLASVKDLERVVRAPMDPRRFRGNLYIAGAAPWEENHWVGREVTVGAVRGLVTERIERCRATCVNPDTAEVDHNVPLALRQGFGHTDCGVFLRILENGTLSVGDTVDAAQ